MKKTALLILLASALGLTACGRRGPLEAPSATANPQAATQTTQAAPVEDNPFILDGLIQ